MTLAAQLQFARPTLTLDVAFEIGVGVTGLYGPSGSGKTTLLRCIAGLERARGSVRVNDIVWQDESRFLPTHRRGVGYVFQEPSLLPHLDVRENLLFAWSRVPLKQRRFAFDATAEWLGLIPLLNRGAEELSGGERQRVAIARALLTSPTVLLMDEPLAAMDVSRKRELLPYLEQLAAHATLPILYVTHSFDEIAQLAERMIVLDRGRIQAEGAVTELATRLDLALAHADDAETLIEATVERCDAEFHLSYLASAIGPIALLRDDLTPAQKVRARIHARDVSIALDMPTRSSVLNIFPAIVIDRSDEAPGRVLLRLDANGVVLLARITQKSATALALTPGQKVYAQVKSVALAS